MVPPNSLESEQGILGSILLDDESMFTVMEMIGPEDYYSEIHRTIYECMLELYHEKSAIDMVTLSSKLKSKDLLDKVGGLSYLTNMMNIVPTTSNVKYYAQTVKDKSILRRLIKASNDIIGMSYEESESLDWILNVAEKRIFDISQSSVISDFKKIDSVLYDVLDNIEEVYTKGSEITGIDSGFIDLNKTLGGLHNSDLILIAARPGMGKTAFGLNIVLNAALLSNAKVAVFSLEMSKNQLGTRLTSCQSMISMDKILKAKIEDEEWRKLTDAMQIISRLDIYIDDTPGIKMNEIRSKCRKLKLERGLDLIMIDYLQLMEGDGKSENRQQEVAKISRALKILAKEMDCPVIALSQLSRKNEDRKNKRPQLSDLRDSGAIEQDADIVLFINREGYRDTDKNTIGRSQDNIAEIIIAKNRHGETGLIELVWLGEYQKFLNKQKSIN